MHDVGLSAWFGGTLANAVALNRGAGQTSQPSDAGAVVNAGWDRWTPVNAAAIGAHLIGSVGQLVANKERLTAQRGAGTLALVKTGLTVTALAVTGYSRVLGRRISAHQAVPVSDGTTPSADTPPDVAAAQRQLSALQWAVPALTGALVVVSSFAGEQQRPASVLKGLTQRVTRVTAGMPGLRS
jgi:hypothetical protein